MISEIQTLLDEYQTWLRDETSLKEIDDWVEITTPWLDRHNDCIQLYVKKDGDGFLLTDDAYTIQDLEQSGCSMSDSPRRQALLDQTLKGFGVQLEDQALQARASQKDFSLRKHNLIQAILAVNDMFYLVKSTVAKIFSEDVAQWLDEHQLRYTPQMKFSGRSGYDHLFDFVIPKSSQEHPERMVRAINRPDKNTVQSLAFAWLDTRGARPAQSRLYAILNDAEGPPPDKVVSAFDNYDIHSIPWSERGQALLELAA